MRLNEPVLLQNTGNIHRLRWVISEI